MALGGIVGVQRLGLVSGQTGLNGNLRGFRSRISIMMMSGVAAQDEHRRVTKVEVDFGVDLGLADAVEFMFVGSSTVMMLLLPLLRRVNAAYNVVVLRSPVGPDEKNAVWLADGAIDGVERWIAPCPDGSFRVCPLSLSEQTQDNTFAESGERGRRRGRPRNGVQRTQGNTAILRQALFDVCPDWP